ncbi:DUF2516 family protein [Nocardioides seonyuensis]|uniref:DUF2516 family protein n=1 Tax=Nocardioides seonyuensis TaxID=2518371 RepID=A0A4P7IGK4_9ACTN|nr:DUF2516 family protein [Nocardioides seonyuensis]QBX55890.1 DUF2516 family protein [Nocardioides seonyuensis]
MNVFEVQSWVMLVILLAVLAIKGFAFVNALLWSGEAYEAAGKLTKPAWCAITGLGFVTALIPIGLLGGLLGIIFLVAALVYLADVRPALREVTSHRR